MTIEQIGSSSKKVRGMARESLELIQRMRAIAKAVQRESRHLLDRRNGAP